MLRAPLRLLIAALTFSSGLATAQQVEDAWKDLVMSGLYAAGEKDNVKAEQQLLKALKEAEHFGAGDVRVGTTLNSLGLVYRAQKKLAEAESAFRRSLTILDNTYGPDSIDVG